MKLIFNKNFENLIKLFKNEKSEGIIIGNIIGDYIIMENLIPMNSNSIIKNYKKIFNLYKNRFLGEFYFNQDSLILNELFLGDYVLMNKNNKIIIKRIDIKNNKISLIEP